MEVVSGDLLTIDGKNYITLEVLNYENENYAFVNLVTDEKEPTEDFYIFKILENNIRTVTDENLSNILLPKFQKLLEDSMKEMLQN